MTLKKDYYFKKNYDWYIIYKIYSPSRPYLNSYVNIANEIEDDKLESILKTKKRIFYKKRASEGRKCYGLLFEIGFDDLKIEMLEKIEMNGNIKSSEVIEKLEKYMVENRSVNRLEKD